MSKTIFSNGSPVTPSTMNALNSPVFKDIPNADGEILYPDKLSLVDSATENGGGVTYAGNKVYLISGCRYDKDTSRWYRVGIAGNSTAASRISLGTTGTFLLENCDSDDVGMEILVGDWTRVIDSFIDESDKSMAFNLQLSIENIIPNESFDASDFTDAVGVSSSLEIRLMPDKSIQLLGGITTTVSFSGGQDILSEIISDNTLGFVVGKAYQINADASGLFLPLLMIYQTDRYKIWSKYGDGADKQWDFINSVIAVFN